jgi:hypothetical protein
VDVKKCTRSNEISSKEIILDGDDPVGKELSCPENGIRYKSREIAHSSCPWVMTIYGQFKESTINTLRDIPNTLLVPPETRYSLASVILFDGGHFRGISLDQKNSNQNHLLFDGFESSDKRIQVISLDDSISKYSNGYDILELWYVKFDSSLMHQELHLL